MKIQKKNGGGVGLGGVRVDVNKKLKFVKIQKKNLGWGVWGGGVRLRGGGGGWM